MGALQQEVPHGNEPSPLREVATREVEEVIHQSPEATVCAFVGEPDDLLGQSVKAHVTLKIESKLVVRDIVRYRFCG